MRNRKERQENTTLNNPEKTAANPTTFQVVFTAVAKAQVDTLAKADERKHRKVLKTLGLLTQNPRYPGLNSHKIETVKVPGGEDVWESYVENNTPGTYRLFWFYGPASGTITVFGVTPHP